MSNSQNQPSPIRQNPAPSTSGNTIEKKGVPNFMNPNATFITLIVSENEQFVVHKDLICHFSPQFKALFSNLSENHSINLPSVDVRLGGLFVHWIYTQRLLLTELQDDNHSSTANTDACLLPLVRLWVIGERYSIPQLKRDVLAHLYNLARCMTPGLLSLAKLVYSELQGVSKHPVKTIIVKAIALSTDEILLEWRRELPPDLLFDVMLFLQRKFLNEDEGEA